MSSVDPKVLVESLAFESASRRCTWLRDLANRLEKNGPTDITDINGLRSLAQAFERGMQK